MADIAKHTPTPWHLERQNDYSPLSVVATSDVYVADCTSQSDSGEQDAANAAFIVRACNAHDNLVATLEAIADQLERIGDTRPHKDGQFIEDARTALAKAKGQSQ